MHDTILAAIRETATRHAINDAVHVETDDPDSDAWAEHVGKRLSGEWGDYCLGDFADDVQVPQDRPEFDDAVALYEEIYWDVVEEQVHILFWERMEASLEQS